jgi:hypothetical protein
MRGSSFFAAWVCSRWIFSPTVPPNLSCLGRSPRELLYRQRSASYPSVAVTHFDTPRPAPCPVNLFRINVIASCVSDFKHRRSWESRLVGSD